MTATTILATFAALLLYVVASIRSELRLIARDFAANDAGAPLPNRTRRRSERTAPTPTARA